MSMNLAATSVASAPSAATTASATLPALGGEAVDVGFPWAGAALLVLLGLIAIFARWRGTRGHIAPGKGLPAWLKPRDAASTESGLGIRTSVRLDAHTQLHTVRWGDRELLVATSLNASPVLLDSRAAVDRVTSA